MELKFIYTNHVLDRLKERFNLKWNWDYKPEVYRNIDEIMAETNLDKSYLNNTKFMINLQDLHGFDSQYEFRTHTEMDIVFVMIIEKGKRIVKTCYPLSGSAFITRKTFQKQKDLKRYTPRSKRHRAALKEWEAMEDHLTQSEDEEIESMVN